MFPWYDVHKKNYYTLYFSLQAKIEWYGHMTEKRLWLNVKLKVVHILIYHYVEK
jgi:hypothetical protein